MMLFIDGAKQGIFYENVNYHIRNYESGFDLLNSLVAEGWYLEEVILVDNGTPIVLPVEAFDGQPVAPILQDLKKEWQQVLKQTPRQARVHDQFLAEVIKRQIKQLSCRIDQLRIAISNYEQRLEMSQYGLYSEARQRAVKEQLKYGIALFRKQLDAALARQNHLRDLWSAKLKI